jgi:hypothetical protein
LLWNKFSLNYMYLLFCVVHPKKIYHGHTLLPIPGSATGFFPGTGSLMRPTWRLLRFAPALTHRINERRFHLWFRLFQWAGPVSNRFSIQNESNAPMTHYCRDESAQKKPVSRKGLHRQQTAAIICVMIMTFT